MGRAAAKNKERGREAAQKGRWPRSGRKQGMGREAAQKVFGVVGAKRRPAQNLKHRGFRRAPKARGEKNGVLGLKITPKIVSKSLLEGVPPLPGGGVV